METLNTKPLARIKIGDLPISCHQMFAKKMFIAYCEKREKEIVLQQVKEKLKSGATIIYASYRKKHDIKLPKEKQWYINHEIEWRKTRRQFEFTDYWQGINFYFKRILRTVYWGNFIFEFDPKTKYLYFSRLEGRQN